MQSFNYTRTFFQRNLIPLFPNKFFYPCFENISKKMYYFFFRSGVNKILNCSQALKNLLYLHVYVNSRKKKNFPPLWNKPYVGYRKVLIARKIFNVTSQNFFSRKYWLCPLFSPRPVAILPTYKLILYNRNWVAVIFGL